MGATFTTTSVNTLSNRAITMMKAQVPEPDKT